MEDDNMNDGEKDATEEQMVDSGGLDSSEEGFIRGYTEDEKIEECAECGTSISEGKGIAKEIEGEKYTFCSKSCADEFEESLAPGS